jgi:nitroimidazol reductase NimA-like FMN-containing flavoprotein (pyridoxamine 5'-phosphate oxidase superfamily)
MAQRALNVLTTDECLTLLRRSRVGRLVYLDDLGPVAVPVNFAMIGDDVVFRVSGGTKQAAMNQPSVAFEVDHIQDDERSGWSVIVRGNGQEIPLREVPQLLRGSDGNFPAPWANGVHNVWLRITPEKVTGRRLGDETYPLLV